MFGMSRGGGGVGHVSLRSGSNIARSSDGTQGSAHAKDRPLLKVPNLRYSSAAAEKCLFCFDESLVLFLSSHSPAGGIFQSMFWRSACDTGSGNWWKVLNAGNLFLPGVSVIYWIFVMQRYAPQSNRDELLVKSAEDWFPYWNSAVRYCQPSCVCENLQFESIYKCAIYIKTRCLYWWDTARNSPKFHNSSLNKVINCGAPFLRNHQLRVFCLARMKIFYFMTSVYNILVQDLSCTKDTWYTFTRREMCFWRFCVTKRCYFTL